MKTIGAIGGITWLSSADYYRLLNEKNSVQARRVEFFLAGLKKIERFLRD
jgi:aspartate/glutamate racemase